MEEAGWASAERPGPCPTLEHGAVCLGSLPSLPAAQTRGCVPFVGMRRTCTSSSVSVDAALFRGSEDLKAINAESNRFFPHPYEMH